jgi:hypothetical protein
MFEVLLALGIRGGGGVEDLTENFKFTKNMQLN